MRKGKERESLRTKMLSYDQVSEDVVKWRSAPPPPRVNVDTIEASETIEGKSLTRVQRAYQKCADITRAKFNCLVIFLVSFFGLLQIFMVNFVELWNSEAISNSTRVWMKTILEQYMNKSIREMKND